MDTKIIPINHTQANAESACTIESDANNIAIGVAGSIGASGAAGGAFASGVACTVEKLSGSISD